MSKETQLPPLSLFVLVPKADNTYIFSAYPTAEYAAGQLVKERQMYKSLEQEVVEYQFVRRLKVTTTVHVEEAK